MVGLSHGVQPCIFYTCLYQIEIVTLYAVHFLWCNLSGLFAWESGRWKTERRICKSGWVHGATMFFTCYHLSSYKAETKFTFLSMANYISADNCSLFLQG